MMRWLMAALLAAGALLAGAAAALDVDATAEQLRDDPLLVDPDSTVRIDEAAVRAGLEDLPVPTYVVVLAQEQSDADENGVDGIVLRLVEALDDPRAVVVVVTDGGELQAGEGGASGVEASRLLDRIVQARSDQAFDGTALTGALLEFADAVERDGQEGARRGLGGNDRRTAGLAGLVGVAVLAGALLWSRSQRRVRQAAPLTDAEAGRGGW
jgi:hypothetical protein